MHLSRDLPDRSHTNLVTQKETTEHEMAPLLESSINPPRARWVKAREDKNGKPIPQAIAHRGYKAQYPENTMAAFDGAVQVGADALETDIHLTKDNVVVLSHDADLKRCFGQTDKIIDCNWDYLSTLRTTREPHVPMPRLIDLLEYLSLPGHECLWALLDIKLDNNADDVMRLIAQTLDSIPPSSNNNPWSSRIVLGIWAAKYLPLCSTYLPSYPISHIGFSTSYARQFLCVPNVSFNMLQPILLGPLGNKFIRDIRDAEKALFVWTVNDEEMMRWSLKKEVDGVITDQVGKFLDVRRDWDSDQGPEQKIKIPMRMWLYTLGLYILITIFKIFFSVKFPEKVKQMVKDQQSQPPSKASRMRKGYS